MPRNRRGHASIRIDVHAGPDDGKLHRMVVDHLAGGAGRRWFTADEYHRIADAGILAHDERLELIDGEIRRMPVINSPHAAAVDKATRALVLGGAKSAIVRVQSPIRLNLFSEPQPDLVVLRLRDDFYASRHPGPADVLLVIEVADSSLRYDRDVKTPLYARAGIAEYWLVDLNGQLVTCNSEPADGRYVRTTTWRRGQSMTPALLPGVTLPVDDFLVPSPSDG